MAKESADGLITCHHQYWLHSETASDSGTVNNTQRKPLQKPQVSVGERTVVLQSTTQNRNCSTHAGRQGAGPPQSQPHGLGEEAGVWRAACPSFTPGWISAPLPSPRPAGGRVQALRDCPECSVG